MNHENATPWAVSIGCGRYNAHLGRGNYTLLASVLLHGFNLPREHGKRVSGVMRTCKRKFSPSVQVC
uniref:Transposase n=1 Tax=Panagrellus redivivus TaxID=6233 RepID=A0A7E4ZTP7_PANRE